MLRALLWLFLLGLQACAAMPLTTSRDASILEAGEERDEFSLAAPAVSTSFDFSPTIFGGSVLEYQSRRGLGDERERAFRVGLSTDIRGPSGLYGGLERARSLRKGTRDWGTVGYVGALAGFDSFFGAWVPNHMYGQLYGGLVVGKVTGTFRPELNARLTLQSGTITYDPYGLIVLTLEPRYRFEVWNRLAYVGLGLDVGYLACEDCVAGTEPPTKGIVGFHPTVGLTFP
jgi:hypothetical protein